LHFHFWFLNDSHVDLRPAYTYPIVLGGMAGHTSVPLVAAVPAASTLVSRE
jgi:hypothetical protein